MKPKLVGKDSFQSSGENATSRVLGSDSDSATHSGPRGGGGGRRVSLKIVKPLCNLSHEKTMSWAARDELRETKLRRGPLKIKY